MADPTIRNYQRAVVGRRLRTAHTEQPPICRTYKYALHPTKAQTAFLDGQLREAQALYNAALEERISAWKTSRSRVNYYTQANQLKAIKASGDLGLVNFSCCQDVLRRVDKAFKGFYRRVRIGAKKPGFPRYRSARRYDSLTYPAYGTGCQLLKSRRLRVQGIDPIRVRQHRPVNGTIKTATIKRHAGQWFVCLCTEVAREPLPVSSEQIGMDLGLTHFATLSDGTNVDDPRDARSAFARLRRAQRKVFRRKKGGRRRFKAVRLFQLTNSRIHNQRSDFHHKLSRSLVNRYGYIAVEDLQISVMAEGLLAKSVRDAGWASFVKMLVYKAESADRRLAKVDPRGTSQHCICGAHVPKTISVRWHECPACGLSGARDHVSAQLILARAGLPPSSVNVEECASCVA